MLDMLCMTRVQKPMMTGRTGPVLMECEDDDGRPIDVVVKYAAGMDQGTKYLCVEAIAAMLATDLDLPVPTPYLVKLDPELIAAIGDESLRLKLQRSGRYAFGSGFLNGGFTAWPKQHMVPGHLCEEAAEVFTFDALVVNSDRRAENPNCLFSGSQFKIFDHELTFNPRLVLFWKAPWLDGGFDDYVREGNHIFAKPYLEKVPSNLNRFSEAWKAIPPERFSEYVQALPPEWEQEKEFYTDILDHLKLARQNIDAVITRSLAALT